jgi:CheY-like chemotaxis protein
VADGAAVLEQAKAGEFDLVLMDFQMPVLDGLSATRAIRAHEAATGRRRTPVIAMTASVLAEHRRASVEVGMDGFASKPVDWFTLSHEIARVLGLAHPCADKDTAGIPGPAREVLNRRAGLRRWADKADVYLEALEHFGRQYGDLATTLQLHAAGGAHQELRMLAHKVRGVAANVGLEQLSDALSKLEQATNAVPTDEREAAAALEISTAALGEALNAIRAGSAQPAPTLESSAAFDLTRARRAGGVLLEALRRGALDDGALAGLAAALAGHPVAPRVAQVQSAIGDFEFDVALEQLETVMATLAEQD